MYLIIPGRYNEELKNNVYAFIDSQNLNLGVSSQGWKLDFRRFRVYLRDQFKVTKAFIFIGYIEENEDLYKALKTFGYELVYKPTVDTGDGKTKGNVDAELVLYSAAIEYRNYDKAVIVSGDGDFGCLVEYLIKKNKLKSLLIPNSRRYSSLLVPFKKYIIFLSGLRSKLSYGKKAKKNGSVTLSTNT